MTRGDLGDLRVWGRPIKPLGLGVAWLMGVLTVYNGSEAGLLGATVLGHVVAVMSAVACVSLVVAWLARSQVAVEAGLLLAAVVYAVRAAFLLFTIGPRPMGVWLSVGGVILAGGAYLLETWDRRPALREQ